MPRGDEFERRVFQWLQSAIHNGVFGLAPNNVKVARRHKLHSRDRDDHIIFDVVVKLYRSGARLPYLLWIWECKDYAHSVPVDDIEEFHSKLEQVGRDKTKGTLITTAGFQRGVLALAKNYGIGLMRVVPRDPKLSENRRRSPSADPRDVIGAFDRNHDVEATYELSGSERSRRQSADDLMRIAASFLGGRVPVPEFDEEPPPPQPTAEELLLGAASTEDCFVIQTEEGRIVQKGRWEQTLSFEIASLPTEDG